MDARLSPLPPTAQVAAQQGEYLAKLFTSHHVDGKHELSLEGLRPFVYHHCKGLSLYISVMLGRIDYL